MTDSLCSTQDSSWVNLVVALAAEAKPLQSWYGLKRDATQRAYPVFRNQHIALIISGLGKLNAAAATGYLHALNGSVSNSIWLNIGIAGHAHRPVGTGLLAHQVVDASMGVTSYPPLPFELPCVTERVVTVDTPDLAYAQAGAVEMEASGFLHAAQRYTTRELVQCYKVVSDNPGQDARQLEPAAVSALIGQQLSTLDRLLQQLGRLSNELTELSIEPELLRRYQQHWRFTVTQRHRLEALLKRWRVLAPAAQGWNPDWRRIPHSKQLLSEMSAHLDQLAVERA